jgi:hypothetical protein
MKRINKHYDRDNNKYKQKMHLTFNFVKIIYSLGTETSSVYSSSVSSRLA